MKQIKTLTWSLLLVLVVGSVASACPTCKESLGGEHASMIQGYFWSILFMMSMPFLLLSSLCLYFYIIVWRARATGVYAEMAANQAVALANQPKRSAPRAEDQRLANA